MPKCDFNKVAKLHCGMVMGVLLILLDIIKTFF